MLTLYTSKPGRLWDAIGEALRNDEIETWEMDSDEDFTHTPDQWHNHAWITRAHFVPGEAIVFGIVGRKS